MNRLKSSKTLSRGMSGALEVAELGRSNTVKGIKSVTGLAIGFRDFLVRCASGQRDSRCSR